MAINFNRESVWDLKPIPVREVRDDVLGLLLEDEEESPCEGESLHRKGEGLYRKPEAWQIHYHPEKRSG